MEDQNIQKSIESRLKSEKVEAPSLSDLYKERMTQKILNSSNGKDSMSRIKGQGLNYKYYLVAALVIVSCAFFMMFHQKPETIEISPLVKASAVTVDAKMVSGLFQKLDPDQLGTYASLLLSSDSSINHKYQSEFQALGLLSNRIVTSFYEDFKPAKTLENN